MTRASSLARALAIAVAVAAPSSAAAELWSWTDAEGEERWTDDPSSVPPEQRSTLKLHGDEEDDDSSFSAVDPRNVAPPPESEAEKRAREARREQRRLLEAEELELIERVKKLRGAYTRAANEHRRYRVGGRIGAHAKAAAAEREAARLGAELDAAEKNLSAVQGRLELLRNH